MNDKRSLLDFDLEDLEKELEFFQQKPYRAKQIFTWLSKGITSIDEMTNISKELKEKLKEKYYIKSMNIENKLISKIDNTRKYIMRLNDDNIIESVLMQYEHGYTACISSQVGCKMGCVFCASAKSGFVRNLSSGEMVDQILTMQEDASARIGNVVIMGIGEPLDNYDNVIKFFKIVTSHQGLNIGFRHISISTCGLVKEILKLIDENMPISLAISLHATNDKVRSEIMPINKAYPIREVMKACKTYISATKRRVMFEYALIEGVNDTKKHAYELVKLLRGMICIVNLIPVNEVAGTSLSRSKRQQIEMFRDILKKNGVEATIRRELGSDINAACGQLRRDYLSK